MIILSKSAFLSLFFNILFIAPLLIVDSVRLSKSLFDELPLNGAIMHPHDVKTTIGKSVYVTPPPSFLANMKPTRKRVRIKEGGLQSIQFRPHSIQDIITGKGKVMPPPRQRPVISPSQQSLFDTLPNQGAIDTKGQRTTRDSDLLTRIFEDHEPHHVQFDIEDTHLKDDFSLNFFNSQVLSPVVNDLARNTNALIRPVTSIPILHAPQHNNGGYGSRIQPHQPQKNEVHYHYHLSQPPAEQSTTTTKTTAQPPPSSSYGPPQQQQQQSTTQKPGGYPSSRSRVNANNVRLTQDYDYEDFSSRTLFTPPPLRHFHHHHGSQQGGNQGGNQGGGSSQQQQGGGGNNQQQENNNQGGSSGGGGGGYPASMPSQQYGPPYEQYGPPPMMMMSTTTTTTAAPPAPPPQDQPIPPEKHETSITFHTIPVTHQVTQLIQVPTITQSISSHVPSDQQPQQDEGQPPAPPPQQKPPPPSSMYGPPDRIGLHSGRANVINGRVSSRENPKNTRVSTVDRSLTTDSQLARLLLGQGAVSHESTTLEDLLLLSTRNRLQPQQQTSFNPFLLGGNSNAGLFGNNAAISSFNQGSPLFRPLGTQGLASNLNLRNSFGLGGNNIGFNNNPHHSLNNLRSNGQIVPNPLLQSQLNSNGFGNNNNGLSPETSYALSELIREQRLQNNLADLRSRLRDQTRGAERTRQNYRNLFYTGALLLSALTLLPNVASLVNPLATTTPSNYFPNYMVPVSNIGRRKRSTSNEEEPEVPIILIAQVPAEDTNNNDTKYTSFIHEEHLQQRHPQQPNEQRRLLTPFEKCLTERGANVSVTYPVGSMQWIHCAKFLNDDLIFNRLNLKSNNDTSNSRNETNKEHGLHGVDYHQKDKKDSESLFDQLPFNGAYVPETIRADLEKYLTPEEILINSQCLQKYFCTYLVQVARMRLEKPLTSLYSMFSRDIKFNPWIRESVTAAKKNRCHIFYCHQDYKKFP